MTEQQNWSKAFLAWPIPKPPGTFFLYDTGATYMLSAIVQKVTGQKILDYLQPRLLEPLRIPAPPGKPVRAASTSAAPRRPGGERNGRVGIVEIQMAGPQDKPEIFR